MIEHMLQNIWFEAKSPYETGLREEMYVKIIGDIDFPLKKDKLPSYEPCRTARIWIHGLRGPVQGDWIYLSKETKSGRFFNGELVENLELSKQLDELLIKKKISKRLNNGNTS